MAHRHELLCIICIAIDDAHTGLLEDAALIVLVLLEIGMLMWTDVVWFNIREDAIVKGNGVHTMQLKGLA